eukprot:Gb_14097 [translate_table: standard]
MCNNLKASMHQRPIPLDSTFNSFLEGLNRRVASTNKQVEALESMSIDTISFQELLGHCNELYKQNDTALAVLEDQLKKYGYEPEEIDSSGEPSPSEATSPRPDRVSEMEAHLNRSFASQTQARTPNYKTSTPAPSYLSFTPASVRDSGINAIQDDSMFEDSLSLQDLGLSDACLATLAGEAKGGSYSPDYDMPKQPSQENKYLVKEMSFEQPDVPDFPSNSYSKKDSYENSFAQDLPEIETSVGGTAVDSILHVSKADYDKAPSWLKGLASWEDLDDATGKINSILSKRAKQASGKSPELFDQDDLEPIGLGPKVKAYLLLLVRMNHLTIEHQTGATMYRVNSK